MAKEDFCFTYYDGDAARDMAHMNRLERGGYVDLIISQRKFGHMKLSLIKKTLGSDFENIFPSIELILKKDRKGYYIEWIEMSVNKMQKFTKKQHENGLKGGRPKAKKSSEFLNNDDKVLINNELEETQTKPKDNPNETQQLTQTITQKKPLEDGDGYVLEGCIKEVNTVKNKVVNNSKSKKQKENFQPVFENKELQKTWDEWEEFHKEIRKPLRSTSRKKQSELLSHHTPDEAIAILNQSMLNGWQGLFEIKNNSNGNFNGNYTNKSKPTFTSKVEENNRYFEQLGKNGD